jgi:DNA modification methylase
MNVAMVDIQRVIPYARNPRKNELAVAKVAASIKEFGWRQPIVVDSEMVIVVGHTRYLAAMQLGLEKVPVHVAEGLTKAQCDAYRLMDNRSHEDSEWDEELLSLELKDLKEAGFDLQLTGFEEDELAEKLAAAVLGGEGLTDPDEVPEPPDEAITQPGDLWILGDHRLLCGDSSSVADVDSLLGGATIQLVNTDPPYNVKVEPRSNNAIAAGNSSFTKTHHQSMDLALHPGKDKPTTRKMRPKDRPLMNDFVSDEAFEKLLRAWFGNIARVLEPGRSFYVWGGYANCGNYPPVLKENKLYFSQAIIWVKEHPVLTRKDFMGNHEWCQPPGTQVLSESGTVPIESLRDGDRVVSFSRISSAIIGLRRGLAVQKAERDYDGDLFGVVADRKSTWSTDGHLWNVKLTADAGAMWCVYLMRRGNWWRVGKSKLLSTWGFGLQQRMFTEGGEHGWILSVHSSNAEAALAEQFVSIHYGIPTMFWRESAKSRRSEAPIRRLYEKLDLDVLAQSAMRALTDHHRRVEHPFITNGKTRPKYGRRVPMIVRACNLLPGAMAVPVPAQGGRFTWAPIQEVPVARYHGKVYSLDVDRYHHYIADGIVTHNCFYGWKEGAAHVFLGPNNVPDVWSVKKVNPQSMVHLCLHPDALVLTESGYRPIRSIALGDRVYAGDGRFHPVIGVSSHPYQSSDLVRIMAKGGNVPTLASDNHPFLVWRPERIRRRVVGGQVGWVRADEIRVGDYTMTPLLKEPEEDPYPDRDEEYWFLRDPNARRGRVTHLEHEGRKYALRYVKSVERVPYTGEVWNLTVEGSHTFQTAVGMSHNTEKPVELAVRAMQYSSRPGENVLDLFGGSGSTLIAAEQTGRKAFLMEIDPLYCDVIAQRFENFTGKKPERVPRGERVAV